VDGGPGQYSVKQKGEGLDFTGSELQKDKPTAMTRSPARKKGKAKKGKTHNQGGMVTAADPVPGQTASLQLQNLTYMEVSLQPLPGEKEEGVELLEGACTVQGQGSHVTHNPAERRGFNWGRPQKNPGTETKLLKLRRKRRAAS